MRAHLLTPLLILCALGCGDSYKIEMVTEPAPGVIRESRPQLLQADEVPERALQLVAEIRVEENKNSFDLWNCSRFEVLTNLETAVAETEAEVYRITALEYPKKEGGCFKVSAEAYTFSRDLPRVLVMEDRYRRWLSGSHEKLSPIEGIWISGGVVRWINPLSGLTRERLLPEYRLAVITARDNSPINYVATVLATQSSCLRPGDIKATLRHASTTGQYEVRWFDERFVADSLLLDLEEGPLHSYELLSLSGAEGEVEVTTSLWLYQLQPTESATSESLRNSIPRRQFSGFLIHEGGYLATSARDIPRPDRLRVAFPGSPEEYEVELFACDGANSMAILRLKNFEYESVFTGPIPYAVADTTALSDTQMRLEETDLLFLGYPSWSILGSRPLYQITEPEKLMKRWEDSDKERLDESLIDALMGYLVGYEIHPGMHGGPLFHRDGRLVGLALPPGPELSTRRYEIFGSWTNALSDDTRSLRQVLAALPPRDMDEASIQDYASWQELREAMEPFTARILVDVDLGPY